MRIVSALRRGAVPAASVALGLGVLVALPAPAVAADGGPAPIEQRSASTVTADALPTVQIDSGVVWAQTVVGNTVYVGGSFSNARPAGAAAGTSLTPRSNLLAYDIRTGNLISSWAPSVNGQVKTIEKSPDGTRIYVGGSFNTANGQTRWNIAAFDAQTGALVSGFNPSAGGSYVNSIVASGSTVYVGGLLGAGNGVTRKNLLAVNTSGQLLGWAPTTDLQVDSMVKAPGTSKLIIAGRFGMVNGVAQRGLAALDLTDGSLQPWEAPSTVINGMSTGTNQGKAGIWSLTADADAVYGTGWVFANKATGNLEGMFSASPDTGKIRWIADCHGDHYGVYSSGTTVYSTGHEHACETMGGYPQKDPTPGNMRNATAVTAAPKGTLLRSQNVSDIYADWSGWPAPAAINWYPDWYTGTASGQGQAGWTVTGTGDYISVGGEFPGVNGKGQYGLVRFSSKPAGGAKEGPRLSGDGWVPTVTSSRAGVARLTIPANWDRDDRNLTYEVTRVGTSEPVYATSMQSSFWDLPSATFADKGLTPGATYSYRVRAIDGDGNSALSKTVDVTISDAQVSNYAGRVLDDGASLYWPLGGTSSTKPDLAGTNPGTAGSRVTNVTPGAISGDTGSASGFNGSSSGLVSTTNLVPAPGRFSVELWFKTNTRLGGKLAGFGSAQTGSSNNYDRHLYMRNDGRLVFGTYAGATQTIATSAAYNDNKWHHVVGTQGADGMRLYLDGALQGANASTGSETGAGYWRVGGDNLGGWPDQPISQWFSGSIDEFAVYPEVLSATSVKTHRDLGVGQQPPVASFQSDATNLVASFDAGDSSAAVGRNIASYAWDFGDQTAAGSGATTSHSYSAAGSYTVKLTVTDSEGASSSTSKVVTVTAPHPAPVARFSVDQTGMSASFDGTASSADDGATVTGYAWAFGDGTTSTEARPKHAYQTPGTYTASLRVTDSTGATSAEETHSVTVTHADPVAAFVSSVAGRAVSVDASGSSASDDASLTYQWTWGDGSADGSGKTASHTYDADGSFDVTLKVTDSLGGTKSVSKSVSVSDGTFAAKDAFGRSVASGWGSADVGGAWSGTAGLSVADGAGVVTVGKSDTRATSLTGLSAGNSDSRFEVSTNKVADGGGVHVNYVVHESSDGEYRLKLRFGATGVVNVGIAKLVGTTETLISNKVLAGYTHEAGKVLNVRLETATTGGSTTLRAKVWPKGTDEPADWYLTTTDSQAALQGAGRVGFSVYGAGSMTNGPVSAILDNLTVR
ncbi:MAG: PKD domain-containing protein [Aeromicrobium sp.]